MRAPAKTCGMCQTPARLERECLRVHLPHIRKQYNAIAHTSPHARGRDTGYGDPGGIHKAASHLYERRARSTPAVRPDARDGVMAAPDPPDAAPDNPRMILGECMHVSETVFQVISWGIHMGWHDIVSLANEAYETAASIQEQLGNGPLYYSMTGRDGGRMEDLIGHWRRARNIRTMGIIKAEVYVARMGRAPDKPTGRSTSPPVISVLDQYKQAALYAGDLFTNAGNDDLGGAARRLGGQLDRLFNRLVDTMPWIDADPPNNGEPVVHNATDSGRRYRPHDDPPDYRVILDDAYIAKTKGALYSAYVWAAEAQMPSEAQWVHDALVAADSLYHWIYGGRPPEPDPTHNRPSIAADVEGWRKAVQRGEETVSIQSLPFPLNVLQEAGPPAYYAASIMKSLGDVVGSQAALRTADGVNRVFLKLVMR